MPIINNLSGNEIEILKLADFLTGVEHDITDVYFGELQVFTVWAETEGTLPLTINANGEPLIDYKIYGNTTQNGTPTPDSPVDVVGCGERTENLFSSTWESGNINSTTGQNETSGTVCRTKDYIPVTPNTIYSMKRSIYTSYTNVRFYRADKTYIGSGSSSTINIIVVSRASNHMLDGVEFCVFELIDTDIAYMRINDASNNVNTRYMMVEGQYTSSTMPTYIPYGYKLPLTANGVEYPIYLGDAQLAKDEYVDSNTGKIYRRTKNLSPPEEEWVDEWVWGDGTVHPSTQIKTSPFIDVSTCETCIMEVFSAETEWAEAGYRAVAFYDANKQYLGWIGGGGRRALTPNSSERLSEFPAGTVYVRIGCSHGDQPFYPQLVSGYTPTHHFYPYLVPTDPPAPLPEIPTFAGTTVIDYAGEGLAPSQFDGVGGWGNLPVKKLNGVPYTGTLPATLQTIEGYLESYKIYGNTVQAGTPTPENPIMPIGCGERTANLFNGYFEQGTTGDGVPKEADNRVRSNIITAVPGAFCVDFKNGENFGVAFDFWNYGRSVLVEATGWLNTKNYITPNNATLVRIKIRKNNDSLFTPAEVIDCGMYSGSTTLPYEPYGYKLPLTVNGVEYPIYLGEVETTRKIKKLVLTGNESWNVYRTSYYITVNDYYRAYDVGSHLSACSHYANSQTYAIPEKHYGLGGLIDGATQTQWNGNIVFNPLPTISSLTDWKSYLVQQYAAGTPVTVWYVLAEPTTGIVNEPLMKIGDYADTIDSTQTSVQIPTFAGTTTISWGGQGLAPSQFDSIQEWVDIPTYKRVNGEWVEDN